MKPCGVSRDRHARWTCQAIITMAWRRCSRRSILYGFGVRGNFMRRKRQQQQLVFNLSGWIATDTLLLGSHKRGWAHSRGLWLLFKAGPRCLLSTTIGTGYCFPRGLDIQRPIIIRIYAAFFAFLGLFALVRIFCILQSPIYLFSEDALGLFCALRITLNQPIQQNFESQ